MTFVPASILAAADPATTPVLRVSTKYMETFVPVQPLSSGTELHAFLNIAGMLDLYSVGTDAKVYRLRRGQDAAAPYTETSLGFSATQLYVFTAAGVSADLPSMFALDDQGKLALATAGPGGSYAFSVTQPAKAEGIIRRFLGVRDVTGKIHINVRLDDGSLGTNFYDLANGHWGGDVWAPVNGPDGKPVKVKDIAMTANDPVQSAIFAIGTDDEVLFAQDSFRTSSLRKLGKKASRLAVVIDSAKRLNVFAVEAGTGLLWVARQTQYATDGKIQFESWVKVDPYQTARLTSIHAGLRLDGRLEVYALDEAGDLNYTRQLDPVKNKPTPWLSLFPIGTGTHGAIFTIGQTATGYSEAYTINADSKLRRFWQSPQTDQWFSEKLELAAQADKLASVPTHAVEITAVDAAGLPLSEVDIRISTSFLVTLWISGSAYRVSAVDPVSVTSGADGKVVIHQRAVSLAGATIIVETPRTPSGAPVLVQPNAELQQKLAGLDKQQILDAKDASGNPLLRSDQRDRAQVAESLAEISKRSMAIAGADETPASIQYKFASRVHAGFRPHLDLSALEGTAWAIDFADGIPTYSNTTVEEVDAFCAEKLAAADLDDVLGIDWGSVWNGIRDGVSWVVDGIKKIAVTIVDGIANVVFYIRDKVFKAALKYAQQALDFIEGVWNYLKVKLEQLYEWLAFLFNLPDFKRTAKAVKHTVDVLLDFSADAVHSMRDKVESGIDNLKANLAQITDTLVGELDGKGNPSLGGYAQQREMSETQSHANDHNLFLNAFNDNQKSVTGGDVVVPGDGVDPDPLQQLIEDLKKIAHDFTDGDGKQAFEEAFQYFDAIGSNRDRALELALSGLVKVLEGVADFVLDATKAVAILMFDLVEAMIVAIKQALFAEWEIPIVSQLYELFSGEKLTFSPVGIVAWIVAIPTTILSKVVLDRAPFPDDASLEHFERTFTVAALKKRLGLATAGSQVTVQDDDDFWSPQLKHNFLVLYSCCMVLRALSEPGQILAHAAGKGIGKPAIVIPALRLLTTGCTAPWIMSPDPRGPGCTPGDNGFTVTIWICQAICGPLRGIVFVKVVPDGEFKVYLGEVTLTLWGAANLVMTAWNYAAAPKTTAGDLAFSRGLLNLIPGQTLRLLALPGLNKPAKMIPSAILVGVTMLSYFGSVGCAIAEIVKSDERTPQGQLAPA